MPKRKVRIAHLTLTVERNGDGFLARCPMVDGGFAEGETVPEAIFNCVDVVRMVFEYRKEHALPPYEGMSEDMPLARQISFAMPVEVPV